MCGSESGLHGGELGRGMRARAEGKAGGNCDTEVKVEGLGAGDRGREEKEPQPLLVASLEQCC